MEKVYHIYAKQECLYNNQLNNNLIIHGKPSEIVGLMKPYWSLRIYRCEGNRPLGYGGTITPEPLGEDSYQSRGSKLGFRY